MGIRSAFPYLSKDEPSYYDRQDEYELERGKAYALDLSVLLHTIAVVFLAGREIDLVAGSDEEKDAAEAVIAAHVVQIVERLLAHGIALVVVVEPVRVEAGHGKEGEASSRSQKREEALQHTKLALQDGDEKAARRFARRAMRRTDSMQQRAVSALQQLGQSLGGAIEVLVLDHGEADPVLVELERRGTVSGTIGKDSDLLFGGGTLIEVKHWSKAVFTKHKLNLPLVLLAAVAALCVSDYSDGVYGVGPSTAFKFVLEHRAKLEDAVQDPEAGSATAVLFELASNRFGAVKMPPRDEFARAFDVFFSGPGQSADQMSGEMLRKFAALTDDAQADTAQSSATMSMVAAGSSYFDESIIKALRRERAAFRKRMRPWYDESVSAPMARGLLKQYYQKQLAQRREVANLLASQRCQQRRYRVYTPMHDISVIHGVRQRAALRRQLQRDLVQQREQHRRTAGHGSPLPRAGRALACLPRLNRVSRYILHGHYAKQAGRACWSARTTDPRTAAALERSTLGAKLLASIASGASGTVTVAPYGCITDIDMEQLDSERCMATLAADDGDGANKTSSGAACATVRVRPPKNALFDVEREVKINRRYVLFPVRRTFVPQQALAPAQAGTAAGQRSAQRRAPGLAAPFEGSGSFVAWRWSLSRARPPRPAGAAAAPPPGRTVKPGTAQCRWRLVLRPAFRDGSQCIPRMWLDDKSRAADTASAAPVSAASPSAAAPAPVSAPPAACTSRAAVMQQQQQQQPHLLHGLAAGVAAQQPLPQPAAPQQQTQQLEQLPAQQQEQQLRQLLMQQQQQQQQQAAAEAQPQLQHQHGLQAPVAQQRPAPAPRNMPPQHAEAPQQELHEPARLHPQRVDVLQQSVTDQRMAATLNLLECADNANPFGILDALSDEHRDFRINYKEAGKFWMPVKVSKKKRDAFRNATSLTAAGPAGGSGDNDDAEDVRPEQQAELRQPAAVGRRVPPDHDGVAPADDDDMVMAAAGAPPGRGHLGVGGGHRLGGGLHLGVGGGFLGGGLHLGVGGGHDLGGGHLGGGHLGSAAGSGATSRAGPAPAAPVLAAAQQLAAPAANAGGDVQPSTSVPAPSHRPARTGTTDKRPRAPAGAAQPEGAPAATGDVQQGTGRRGAAPDVAQAARKRARARRKPPPPQPTATEFVTQCKTLRQELRRQRGESAPAASVAVPCAVCSPATSEPPAARARAQPGPRAGGAAYSCSCKCPAARQQLEDYVSASIKGKDTTWQNKVIKAFGIDSAANVARKLGFTDDTGRKGFIRRLALEEGHNAADFPLFTQRLLRRKTILGVLYASASSDMSLSLDTKLERKHFDRFNQLEGERLTQPLQDALAYYDKVSDAELRDVVIKRTHIDGLLNSAAEADLHVPALGEATRRERLAQALKGMSRLERFLLRHSNDKNGNSASDENIGRIIDELLAAGDGGAATGGAAARIGGGSLYRLLDHVQAAQHQQLAAPAREGAAAAAAAAASSSTPAAAPPHLPFCEKLYEDYKRGYEDTARAIVTFRDIALKWMVGRLEAQPAVRAADQQIGEAGNEARAPPAGADQTCPTAVLLPPPPQPRDGGGQPAARAGTIPVNIPDEVLHLFLEAVSPTSGGAAGVNAGEAAAAPGAEREPEIMSDAAGGAGSGQRTIERRRLRCSDVIAVPADSDTRGAGAAAVVQAASCSSSTAQSSSAGATAPAAPARAPAAPAPPPDAPGMLPASTTHERALAMWLTTVHKYEFSRLRTCAAGEGANAAEANMRSCVSNYLRGHHCKLGFPPLRLPHTFEDGPWCVDVPLERGVYHPKHGAELRAAVRAGKYGTEPVYQHNIKLMRMAAGKLLVRVPDGGKCRAPPVEPPGRPLELHEVAAMDPGGRVFCVLVTGDGRVVDMHDPSAVRRMRRLRDEAARLRALRMKRPARADFFRKRELEVGAKLARVRKKFHFSVANYLLRNFRRILLPKFKVSSMVKRKGRVFGKATTKAMLNMGHYEFRELLVNLAELCPSVEVIICDEPWTSKTCAACGEVRHDLGGSKIFACRNRSCRHTCDRDVNGAINILVRYATLWWKGYRPGEKPPVVAASHASNSTSTEGEDPSIHMSRADIRARDI